MTELDWLVLGLAISYAVLTVLGVLMAPAS